jgi:hypothetical protein
MLGTINQTGASTGLCTDLLLPVIFIYEATIDAIQEKGNGAPSSHFSKACIV